MRGSLHARARGSDVRLAELHPTPGRGARRLTLVVTGVLAMACGESTIVLAPEDGEPAPPASEDRPPAISDLRVATLETERASVEWRTDVPSVGRVEYGTGSTYASKVEQSTPATAHSAMLLGLTPGTTYAFRVVGRGVDGTATAVAEGTFTTQSPPEPPQPPAEPPAASEGIWLGGPELALLPTSGPAWDNLVAEADRPCGLVDLSDQDQTTNVCVLAKALVHARTGDPSHRVDVLAALTQIVTALVYDGRALALGRELGTYVIAADLIDLEHTDPLLDLAFRTTLGALRVAPTSGGALDLIDCHERRPNNWGAHCGATRAAIAVYLGDEADLARTAAVFKGYLGDRTSYAGFDYGADLSWQCDPANPVGINPAGCSRDGVSLDGVLPDDQRRGGAITTSPPRENYVWEALQGLLVQAVILSRAGYDVWNWEDRALLRAMRWLHEVADYPAEGDDTWQPHLVNLYLGTQFPAPIPTHAGKSVGFTDWTHR